MHINQNPEQLARDEIDQMLLAAGWVVQSQSQIDFSVSLGIAVTEYQTTEGFPDYVLFADQIPVAIIEAKRPEEGHRITVHEEQSQKYANAKLKYFENRVIPFVYESTGKITRFTNNKDPLPRSREVFSFHRPETLLRWNRQKKSLRGRFFDLPELDETGLRPAQIRAINALENSFRNNRPRALIQMATGAGKTYTATTFVYRLLKFAKAERILFLVDTRNLGEQAEQEFMAFQPQDDPRKFTELYNVQRLTSSYIAPDSQVCISTIQRMYSLLKDEEFDESKELENPNEQSTWLQQKLKEKEPNSVTYNPKVPIEEFDFIIIDECHRSIYNLWRQVLEYFDAFLIGLTATPDKRTFGFFNENVVSEYSNEESILDGVNVPHEIYTIETEISQQGALVKSGWFVDRRDKLTRERRWQQEDEDTDYDRQDLDQKVVNPSQIRNIIKEFKKALETKIFPDRWNEDGTYEVPKTLIFAKSDSHADDIINSVREEFNESNEFCKKVTYKSDEDPKSILSRFRNGYNPRIAVTVDMIATGTDVKPLEVLLFMRDVKSANYFEQMKGRGTRTIEDEKLKSVSRTAGTKTHFAVVDAVGVTRTKKSGSRSLERKHSVPLKDLLQAVTMGINEEDLFLSLSNRLIRLNRQITANERKAIIKLSGGKTLDQIAGELLDAYDPDKIEEKVLKKYDAVPKHDRSPALLEQYHTEVQKEMAKEASLCFNGKLNEYLDNVRKIHEQIIDEINLDTVTRSEWEAQTEETAHTLIHDFTDYINAHKDEIIALSIFYNQPQRRSEITFGMINDLYAKLSTEKPSLVPVRVWEAYRVLNKTTDPAPQNQLAALVALVRIACGIDSKLRPVDAIVRENFKNWILRQNAGQHNRFSPEQTEWLRMIRNHISDSFHLEVDDLDYTPFDKQGGRGKMYQLFGLEMMEIIKELNEALVA